MKNLYEYGARNNLCIWTSYGRVHEITFTDKKGESIALKRGIDSNDDFFYMLRQFMENQAELKTADFMELYIGLTDDPESKAIADEIYLASVDRDRYPISAINKLAKESKSAEPIKKKAGANATFGESCWSNIRVEDGIVTVLSEGSAYAGREVHRGEDADFYNVLYYKLGYLADTKPESFMNFYHMVEGSDDVAFEVAEKVRKNKLAKTNNIFNI